MDLNLGYILKKKTWCESTKFELIVLVRFGLLLLISPWLAKNYLPLHSQPVRNKVEQARNFPALFIAEGTKFLSNTE